MSRKKSKRTPPASGEEREERAERITRLVMKTEVYLSYNLYSQAARAIDEILELDPDHLEGNRLRLQVLEETATSNAIARQLVTLARLNAGEAATANDYLRLARRRVEDDEVRKIAGEQALELNEVMRVAVDTDSFQEPPARWPYVADEMTRRKWLLRRLDDPPELFLESCSPADCRDVAPAVRSLSNAATGVPADDEKRAAMFISNDTIFAIFTNPSFVVVHEVQAHALGRVVRKFQRTSLDAEAP